MKKNRFVAAALLFGLVAAKAYAGFELDPALQASLHPQQRNGDAVLTQALSPTTAPAPAASAVLPEADKSRQRAASETAIIAPVALPPAPQGQAQAVTQAAGVPDAAWQDKIDGFGKNQGAEIALRALLPTGGRLVINSAIDPKARVTWTGNDSRMSIAKKILSDIHAYGQFDGRNLVIGEPPQAADPSSLAQATNAPRLWTMPKGVMLSDGLMDWMEQTGAKGERYRWYLEWDAYDGPSHEQRVDYRIVAPLRFNGTIDEAVAQLIMLYRKSSKPLNVQISKEQRLIHIKLRGSN
ncbi:TcpQ domain-containing protein [Pandoraea sp. ISTKB]|uniref:TcpQ domain-containing protein n=1 Tax=Pandoraea sp. ISTKB TaxID=1586708 RepID=UPI0008479AC4|nr:TcpQ domain-containing protein [Pandoraea sp. ISTKB]ODP35041.1 hypothetical protein A9762_11795 [Pandoraea sp. ISTKB]